MGGIDEAALDKLSLVTEMTKRIRVRSGKLFRACVPASLRLDSALTSFWQHHITVYSQGIKIAVPHRKQQ